MRIITDSPDDVENRDDRNLIGEVDVEVGPGDLDPFGAEYLIDALERYTGDNYRRQSNTVYIGTVPNPWDEDAPDLFVITESEHAETATVLSGRIRTDGWQQVDPGEDSE